MSKRQVLMLLGVLVILFQPGILGFPGTWNKYLLIVIGLVIIAIAYSFKPETRREAPESALPYSEHRQDMVPPAPAPMPSPAPAPEPTLEPEPVTTVIDGSLDTKAP